MAVSKRCQKHVLQYHRRRLGLTQPQLAARAGFSERVIRKAEAGGSVRQTTLDVLAQALSTPQCSVSAQELCSEPLDVVQAFNNLYFRHREACLDHVRPFLADDYVLVIHGDREDMPLAGEWRGTDGFADMLRLAYELLEPLEERVERWFVSGNRVASLRVGKSRVRRAPPGTVLDTWMFNESVVEAGQITRCDTYVDSLVWQRSLKWGGPSPQQA